MSPQIPGYLLIVEATVRPLVTAIALSLIWIGAARVETPAASRYTTATGLSVVLVAWLVIAQYVGSANTYFASSETAVPTVLFGLLIPLMTAAIGLSLSRSIASLVSAIPLPWLAAGQVYRIGGGIFLVLLADGRLPWQFALPAGIGDVTTGAPDPRGIAGRATTQDRHAGGSERHSLLAAHWLPLALSVPRLPSATLEGLQQLSQVPA